MAIPKKRCPSGQQCFWKKRLTGYFLILKSIQIGWMWLFWYSMWATWLIKLEKVSNRTPSEECLLSYWIPFRSIINKAILKVASVVKYTKFDWLTLRLMRHYLALYYEGCLYGSGWRVNFRLVLAVYLAVTCYTRSLSSFFLSFSLSGLHFLAFIIVSESFGWHTKLFFKGFAQGSVITVPKVTGDGGDWFLCIE